MSGTEPVAKTSGPMQLQPPQSRQNGKLSTMGSCIESNGDAHVWSAILPDARVDV